MAKKTTPNRKYTPEFKADVLGLVANGESLLGVAQKMGISDGILPAWPGAEKKTKGSEKSTSTLAEAVESLPAPSKPISALFSAACPEIDQ